MYYGKNFLFVIDYVPLFSFIVIFIYYYIVWDCCVSLVFGVVILCLCGVRRVYLFC